ncbi:hypothetical protein IE53DRAFT_128648 [Violaceomyces palustris]|uniref:Uncharacterized protein n=1 Tax=Violaceomyces palustris TaxID=1673888 RepID=A0ACD0NV89_9BASI|nr:hypothetical protein IE53DRAFT_128648 [Violaceomyces palustris]
MILFLHFFPSSSLAWIATGTRVGGNDGRSPRRVGSEPGWVRSSASAVQVGDSFFFFFSNFITLFFVLPHFLPYLPQNILLQPGRGMKGTRRARETIAQMCACRFLFSFMKKVG